MPRSRDAGIKKKNLPEPQTEPQLRGNAANREICKPKKKPEGRKTCGKRRSEGEAKKKKSNKVGERRKHCRGLSMGKKSQPGVQNLRK